MKFNVKNLFFVQNLLYGFGLVNKNKIKRIKLLLIQMINLVLFGILFYYLDYDPAAFEDGTNELVYGYYIDTTISFVIYLNWILKYEKISNIYDSLIDPFDDKFNSKIMKIGKIFTSLWFIILPMGILSDFMGNIYLQKANYFKNEQSYQDIIPLLLNLVNYYYRTDGIIVYTILNYTFINLLVYLKFKNSIKSLHIVQENVRFNFLKNMDAIRPLDRVIMSEEGKN